MIGTALAIGGLATSVLGGLFSGSKSAKAARRRRLYLDKYENEVNKDLYGDYSQSATAQNANTQMRRLLMDSNARSAGAQALYGGNRASVADDKDRTSNALASLASQTLQQGEAVRQSALAKKRDITAQRMGIEAESSAQSAIAGSQLLKAGADLTMTGVRDALDGSKARFADAYKVGDIGQVPEGKVSSSSDYDDWLSNIRDGRTMA